ncbi:reverse transcriptase domain-containing protein [Tanacetum coccineum]
MPFSLKNARATYQRLIDKAFQKQIGRNLEVYVDDLVIKSRTEHEIIRDIEETFKTLREINMKLNPKKCTFGMEEGMFLGYKVNTKGIKVCPEAETTFKQMKKLIAELPTLTAPAEKEELIVYFVATGEAISAILMTEKEGKQMPIYFVSRALQEDDSPATPMEVGEELPDPWILFMDGSSCIDGSRAGLIHKNPKGIEFTYALRFRFDATNNEAEYEALIAGLKIAKKMGMIQYLEKVKALIGNFKKISIKHVPRSENKKADALRKIASTSFAHLSKQVLVEELKEKSINEAEVLVVVEEEGSTWITLIYEYLMEETLPAEKKKARVVKRKSRQYAAINGILYNKSFLGPWLRCVGPLQENYVLREIHEGSCSMHAGPRSMVAKALRIGYYLPTMHADARKMI